jgi:hypothetical protein
MTDGRPARYGASSGTFTPDPMRRVLRPLPLLVTATVLSWPAGVRAQSRDALRLGPTFTAPSTVAVPSMPSSQREDAARAAGPDAPRDAPHCPTTRRWRHALVGALVGGSVGLLVGHGTGVFANIMEESDAAAAQRRREHRAGGAVLGAGIGAFMGYAWRCDGPTAARAAG